MSNSTLDLSTCSFGTCPIQTSYYGYKPNLGINIFFAVIYGLIILSCLAYIVIFRGKWLAYTIVLGIGAGVEFAGYVLRTFGTSNPWNENPWIIQLIFLTIAPIFMSASVYLSLEYMATTVGHGYLNIRPTIYPRVFIPCDVIALVIQSVGGAISANEDDNSGMPPGVKITIVGLVLQLASLTVVFGLFLSIIIPNRHILYKNGQLPFPETSSGVSSPEKLPSGSKIRNLTTVLLAATLLIVIRSAYRVAELSKGLSGGLETNQWAFMMMDGLLILIATALLAWGHPNLVLRQSRR